MLVVAVVVFDEFHAFFVGVEAEVGGLEMDQTLTVRSRQAVANVLGSFGLIAIFIM